MIDPVVYHPELFHRGLREFRVWPYRGAADDMKKPRGARRGGRWRNSR